MITGCVVYSLLLIWLYINIISPTYSYAGFTYEAPPFKRLFLVYILAHIPTVWMPISLTRPSQVVYWLLYLVVIIPACIIPSFLFDYKSINTIPLAASLVFAFAILGTIYLLPRMNIMRLQTALNISPTIFQKSVALLTISLSLHVFLVFGFNFQFVSLLDVYRIRSQFHDVATGRFVGYSVNWLALVISPLLISYGLTKKNAKLTLIGILISVMIYGLAAYKSVLFSSLLMFMVFFAASDRYIKSFGFWVISGALGLVLTTIVVGVISKSAIIPFFFVGRVVLMPGILTAFFFEFFSKNPKALLGYSIFRTFVNYPYDLVPSLLIGKVYFHNPTAQANVHLWADAYANFGYAGIIIFTLLLGFVLWLFDSFAKAHGIRLVAIILSVHAFTLANSALLTAILSQGIALTLVLLFIMPPTLSLPVHYTYKHIKNEKILAAFSGK